MMEEIGKVTVKIVLYKRVSNGGVFVYKLENDEGNKDIHFNYFYIATFDDLHSEEVWGVGYSVESALKCAEREWDEEVGDEDLNPFTEALEKLKEDKDA